MDIRRGLAGHILYSAEQRSSQPTEEFRPSGVVEPAGGMPALNIYERFFLGPRDWGWLWLGPWPIRFSGFFFLFTLLLVALGVGFVRHVWRRFRLIISLVRLRRWFWTLF